MPRRRTRQALSSSLFPFLSVLACVIGILTLLIAALAIGQMATDLRQTDTPPSNTTATSSHSDAPELEVALAEIARLSTQVSGALAARQRLTELRRRLIDYGFRPRMGEPELERALADRIEGQQRKRRRQQVESEMQKLGSAIEVLKDDIGSSQSASQDARVVILPRGGTAQPLKPYFVECRASGVRLRRKDGSWSEPLSLTDLVARGRFKVFLEKVRSLGATTTVFLVRPDGAESYRDAASMADIVYVRHAKLPIPGQGAIDFQLLLEPDDQAAQS